MSQSVIEQIKDRLDVVDVIGRYVQLRKSGRSFKAPCPFHAEKTPSFFVFPDSGTWRCFGACGVGGDVISFVQRKENLDFPETLRLLAQQAGIELEQKRDVEGVSRLNLLRQINDLAAGFFQHQLLQTRQAEAARAYLQRRQISDETIARFGLGFVPDGWDNLGGYMRQRGHSLDDLEAAGLIVRREDGGGYDRFRDRVMIPIRDVQGHIVGFGGRVLGDGEPKYLNTPQTLLFDKGAIIFALDQARRSIRARDQVVLVEGYMDVISAHQRGFSNVVAAMGTSITPQQLTRLAQYTQNFVFALDADTAGLNAALRSVRLTREVLTRPSFSFHATHGRMPGEMQPSANVKIAIMPAGRDPDDVLREDATLWAHLIETATPLVEFVIQQTAQEEDMGVANGRARLVERTLPLLHDIDNLTERSYYVHLLAKLTKTSERDLEAQLSRYQRQAKIARRQSPVAPSPEPETAPSPFSPTPTPTSATSPSRVGREEHILAYLVFDPDLLRWVDDELGGLRFDPVSIDDFEQSAIRAIFDAQQEFLYSDGVYTPDDFLTQLDSALGLHVAALRSHAGQMSKLTTDQRRKDLLDSLLRLRLKRLQDAARELTFLITHHCESKLEREQWGQQQVRTNQNQKAIEIAIAERSHHTQWLAKPAH